MISLEKLHESETFEIRFDPIKGSELTAYFVGKGFCAEDDFFYADRNAEAEPWQAEEYWSADCFFNGNSVYPYDSNIDQLKIEYLFSALPLECISELKRIVALLIQDYNAICFYKDTPINSDEIDPLALTWRQDLKNEVDEDPGSELLAQLIQEMFYQN